MDNLHLRVVLEQSTGKLIPMLKKHNSLKTLGIARAEWYGKFVIYSCFISLPLLPKRKEPVIVVVRMSKSQLSLTFANVCGVHGTIKDKLRFLR